jgi:2-phosphoglycerate kinase
MMRHDSANIDTHHLGRSSDVGKTILARELARRLEAANTLAADNFKLGRVVVAADCVNPVMASWAGCCQKVEPSR